LYHFLERQAPVTLWTLTCLSLIVLGWIDYLSGYEITLSVFYTIPVALAAWTLGKSPGYFFAILGGLVWLFADQMAGQLYTHPLVIVWNTLARIFFFILSTLLLTELRRALEKQRKLACTDDLTDLLNRRAFYDLVTRELARARRRARPTTLVYLDLDNFKTVNDLHGHHAGDHLLQRVAQSLARSVRTTDAVARLGGDEFAILFPETDSEAAQHLAPRLLRNLRADQEQELLPITFSLGVATYPLPPESVDQLLKPADDLMYEVKRYGKDGIAYAVL
jgi:diguanylate cyclase (GGDEF)-like protein